MDVCRVKFLSPACLELSWFTLHFEGLDLLLMRCLKLFLPSSSISDQFLNSFWNILSSSLFFLGVGISSLCALVWFSFLKFYLFIYFRLCWVFSVACGLLGSFWFGSFKIHFSNSFKEIHVILLYRDHISLNNSGMVLLCIFLSIFLDSNKVAVRPLK